MIIGIFVPVEGQLLHIAPRSGIVGVPTDQEHTHIYYEGNLYQSVNMKQFEQKVARAADRLVARYPTVAQMLVPDSMVVRIGDYDTDENVMRIWERKEYERWVSA